MRPTNVDYICPICGTVAQIVWKDLPPSGKPVTWDHSDDLGRVCPSPLLRGCLERLGVVCDHVRVGCHASLHGELAERLSVPSDY